MNRLHRSRLGSLIRREGVVPAIAISAVAVLLSVAPLLMRGFSMGHDWLLELVRIAEFRHALQDGQWPPYWAINLYQGFGSPIFLFYPPLYLSVAAALAACGAETLGAAVGALVIFSVLGAILIWRFVRGLCRERPAAAATAVVLFSLHPYLLADKWIRNANAEFAALSLLPGVLIGATASEPHRAFWWTAVCLALVILSHNIVALVTVALALAVAAFVHRSLRAMAPIFGGITAALALTAFFWIPAFVLQPLIRTEDLLSGKFDFNVQFPTLTSLVWPTEFYSGGWLTPILILVVLFAPVADVAARRITRAFAVGIIACLLLMLPLTTLIWQTLPLLRYAQFPWRFMGPLAVLIAAGGGIAATRLFRSRSQLPTQIAILAVALLNALPAIRQYESLSSEFANRIEPALTPDGIRSRDLRTTVYDEYLPRGANLNEVRPVEGSRLFKKWAFPVWAAARDGETLQVETGPGGVVAVRINSETDNVVLSLREPRVRRACKMVSIAAVVILVALAAVERLRRKGRAPAEEQRDDVKAQR